LKYFSLQSSAFNLNSYNGEKYWHRGGHIRAFNPSYALQIPKKEILFLILVYYI
jgi:hypothetical protein